MKLSGRMLAKRALRKALHSVRPLCYGTEKMNGRQELRTAMHTASSPEAEAAAVDLLHSGV